MQAYSVYRVCYRANRTERVGRVMERRKGERDDNAADMLRMAQKLYATSSKDSRIFIIRESSRLRLLFEEPFSPPATPRGE